MDSSKLLSRINLSVLFRIIGVAATVIFCAIILFISNRAPRTDGNAGSSTPIPRQTLESLATVIVDAGHGGSDGGAVGRDSGTHEDVINLAVARLLKTELEANNILVVMTRVDDNALGKTKKEDMRVRKDIISSDVADLTVSVHMNIFNDRSVCGPMVFYMKGNELSQAFAECVVSSLCSEVNFRQRKANPGDYFIVRESKAPAIIVECGFLSNSEDEKKLLTHEYQQTLARGICKGVLEYLNLKSS